MIIELTLISTFVLYHLAVGLGLWIVYQCFTFMRLKPSASVQSLLWFTCFLLVTLLPLSTFWSTDTNSLRTPLQLVQQDNSAIENIPALSHQPKVVEDGNKQEVWHVPQRFVDVAKPLLVAILVLWFIGILYHVSQIIKQTINSMGLSKSLLVHKSLAVGSKLIEIWLSPSISSPMVIGILHPKIIIPNNIYERMSEEQLQHIVLHELAHIQRGDLWTAPIQQLLAVVFWWSPVIRFLDHKLHLSRELACDQCAALNLNQSTPYAQTLLDCARILLSKKQDLLAMSLFGHKKDLAVRIQAMVSPAPRLNLTPFTTFAITATLVTSSVSAAHYFVPKLDIPQLIIDSKTFLRQSRFDSQVLIDAIQQGRIDVIEQMHRQGIDLDVAVIGDGTALIMAIKQNDFAMVERLVELGVNVNQPSAGDGTPLIAAVQEGNTLMVKKLLEAGADVNQNVEGDETPLINAAATGNLELVEFLVSKGANVNLAVKSHTYRKGSKLEWTVRSPLSMAQNKQVKEFLVSNGAIELSSLQPLNH